MARRLRVAAAAFDMDDTLIATKSGRTFAASRVDWRFWSDKVKPKLVAAHAAGYKLAIFTNQAGIAGKVHDKTKEAMICGKIEDVIAEVGVPMQAFVAIKEDHNRKPSPSMWDLMIVSGIESEREREREKEVSLAPPFLPTE